MPRARLFGIGTLLLAAVLCLNPNGAHAQEIGRVDLLETSNRVAYYYFVESGSATVQVQVLGTVQFPGLYELSDGANVGTVLALAGGPRLLARNSEIRGRDVIVRLFRSQGDEAVLFFEAKGDDRLDEAVLNSPRLMDGDLISVEVVEKRRIRVRDVFVFVNSVALTALAVERWIRR